MCPTISWDENKPADLDSLGIGDDQIRSDKTAIRTALDAEHYFPSAGGDAGTHKLGSGRPFYGLQSAVSSTGSDGRLMHTSDTSRLFHVGSGGTSFIGGATAISAGSYPGGAAPQRSYWAMEFGEGRTISGSTTLTYPNSGFSAAPFVTLTPRITSLAADGGAAIMWVSGAGATSFAANSRLTDGASNSTHSFYWHAIGLRTL